MLYVECLIATRFKLIFYKKVLNKVTTTKATTKFY